MSTRWTGPDHFRTSQNLLSLIAEDETGRFSHEDRMELAAMAHTHATLALAAATALGARMGYGLGNDAGQAWDPITTPTKRGGRS